MRSSRCQAGQGTHRGRSAPDRHQNDVAPLAVLSTRLKNAHGVVFRELLYYWHPWFGMRVAIHGAVDNSDGVVFCCTLSGSGADRWLEVPAWMFDRARCLNSPRLTASPFVSVAPRAGERTMRSAIISAK